MIIQIDHNKSIDTDSFSSAERHVLQKIIGWQSLVDSLADFRQKTKSALAVGWNNSGPVRTTESLSLVIQQLEKELRIRLDTQ